MHFIIRSLVIATAVFAATSAYAKTYKYELVDFHTSNGELRYPGLDLSQVRSVIINVNKDSSPETQLKSLEITFADAAKLTATNFQRAEFGKYRALVNDAWVYRQVIVDFDNYNVNPNNETKISIAVSNHLAFLSPVTQEPQSNTGLLKIEGNLRDISTTRVVDTATTVVNTKRLTLSLKDRLYISSKDENSWNKGFAIDALWLGKGAKTLYIDPSFNIDQYNGATAVGLLLEPGYPEGELNVRVVYENQEGYQNTTSGTPLRQLLLHAGYSL